MNVLAGDRDRERAAKALRRHFVDGRLSTAEFAHRVELTLRARSNDELDAAKAGLPAVWEDVPGGVYEAARRVRRGIRGVRRFFVLVRMWFKVNLVFVLASGIALAAGAPVGTTLGALAAAWALATLAAGWLWRRGDSVAPARRKWPV
jgi:hypothetical protein